MIDKSYGTDVDDVPLATTGSSIINLQRTCAPRVTVPCLSVCVGKSILQQSRATITFVTRLQNL